MKGKIAIKTTFIALIATGILLIGTAMSYPDNNDNHYRDDSSNVFAPGYLNAAKCQAEAIIAQQTPQKSLLQNITEFVMGKTEGNVEQAAVDKPKPELQQKQSSPSAAKKITASSANKSIAGGAPVNIAIGSGTNQKYLDRATGVTYDASGAGRVLLSESINGVTNIYAGFADYGTSTIEDAIGMAESGDRVIIKGRTYEGGNNGLWVNALSEGNMVPEGVTIAGGYNEDGTRDLINNPTIFDSAEIINMSSGSEIDGITFDSGIEITTYGSDSITINNITTCDVSFNIGNGSVVFLENNTFNGQIGIGGIGTHDESGTFFFRILINPDGTLGQPPSGAGVGLPIYITSQDNNFMQSLSVYGIGDFTFQSSGDYYNNGYSSDNSLVPGTVTANFTTYSNGSYAPVFSFNSPSAGPIAQIASGQSPSNINQLLTQPATDYYSPQLANPYTNNYNPDSKDLNLSNNLNTLFPNLLLNKNNITQNGPVSGLAENLITVNISQNPLNFYALATSTEPNTQGVNLNSVLANPTSDQKVVLDMIKSLLTDMGKAPDEQSVKANPELVKAQNDLLQAIANILLAQGVPNLLQKGEASNIKAIFSELDTQKNKIMLEYAKSTKPYYENMIKDLAKNMAILQSKNLLNPNMAKDELDKLPPSELDKILEKIKNMKYKSFEEEYILQQEAKYRKEYLDPNKKKLESDMKGMLNNFTARLNGILRTTDKK